MSFASVDIHMDAFVCNVRVFFLLLCSHTIKTQNISIQIAFIGSIGKK